MSIRSWFWECWESNTALNGYQRELVRKILVDLRAHTITSCEFLAGPESTITVVLSSGLTVRIDRITTVTGRFFYLSVCRKGRAELYFRIRGALMKQIEMHSRYHWYREWDSTRAFGAYFTLKHLFDRLARYDLAA